MIVSHRNGLRARSSLEARPSFDVPNPGAEEDSAPLMVHPSSTELFYFIGHNLEQCANLGRTGTGKALFDLLGVHKKWLKVYAEDVLLASMKKYRNPRLQVHFSSIHLQVCSPVPTPQIDGEPLRLHSCEKCMFGDQYSRLLSDDSNGGRISTARPIPPRINRFYYSRSSWKKRSEKRSPMSTRKTYPYRASLTYSRGEPVITQTTALHRSCAPKCDFGRHCDSTEGVGSGAGSLMSGYRTHRLVSAELS